MRKLFFIRRGEYGPVYFSFFPDCPTTRLFIFFSFVRMDRPVKALPRSWIPVLQPSLFIILLPSWIEHTKSLNLTSCYSLSFFALPTTNHLSSTTPSMTTPTTDLLQRPISFFLFCLNTKQPSPMSLFVNRVSFNSLLLHLGRQLCRGNAEEDEESSTRSYTLPYPSCDNNQSSDPLRRRSSVGISRQ